MAPKTRWIVLLSLLAVSSALVAFSDEPEHYDSEGTVKAASRRAGAAAKPAGQNVSVRGRLPGEKPGEAMIQEIRPRVPSHPMDKAFAVRNWTPPPPPPPANTSAARPVAPPLPFAFLGKKFEDDEWQVFLGVDDKLYIVKEADLITETYRVDAIRPPTMTFTYLPLHQQQTLVIGDLQ